MSASPNWLGASAEKSPVPGRRGSVARETRVHAAFLSEGAPPVPRLTTVATQSARSAPPGVGDLMDHVPVTELRVALMRVEQRVSAWAA